VGVGRGGDQHNITGVIGCAKGADGWDGMEDEEEERGRRRGGGGAGRYHGKPVLEPHAGLVVRFQQAVARAAAHAAGRTRRIVSSRGAGARARLLRGAPGAPDEAEAAPPLRRVRDRVEPLCHRIRLSQVGHRSKSRPSKQNISIRRCG
jgi:hypothetical protein